MTVSQSPSAALLSIHGLQSSAASMSQCGAPVPGRWLVLWRPCCSHSSPPPPRPLLSWHLPQVLQDAGAVDAVLPLVTWQQCRDPALQ